MSIPLHLQSIKSSGIYRFIWDKSTVPTQVAETLRLVIGYSERGPFNTPVYVNSKTDFINTFGKASKRLERKGVYFHRISDQALGNGPILALNLKPFATETVKAYGSDNFVSAMPAEGTSVKVTDLYDTTKFWTLDPDHLPEMASSFNNVYSILTATDSKENSTTVFIRKTPKTYTTNYHLTVRSWFNNESVDEIPSYLEDASILDTYLDEYFEDIFVFQGQFTKEVKLGALKAYFDATYYPTKDAAKVALNAMVDKMDELIATGKSGAALISSYGTSESSAIKKLTKLGDAPADASYTALINGMQGDLDALASLRSTGESADIKNAAGAVYDALIEISTESNMMADEDSLYALGTDETPGIGSEPSTPTIKENYKDAFGQDADVLLALARDPNSRFIGSYRGIIFPYFKDANGNYISIDVALNADYDSHKLMMKLNELRLDTAVTPLTEYKTLPYNDWTTVNDINSPIYNQGIQERYVEGYNYTTISQSTSGTQIMRSCMDVLDYKGIHEALTNRVDVEYHYILDSFKATPETAALHVKFAALAQAKENAFALINFPAIKDFGSSVIDTTAHTVDMNAVVQKYPIAGESDGASYCAYFTPLLFSDGTVRNIVPSVGLVSNNFMNKYGARQPYYIVAGPTYGRLSATGMVGPEYGFARSELDILEPAGINAIVYTPRLGTYINSNQTAKQAPVSALSKIHVRELVIYLTDEVANLLQNYQWELNTQELRDTIKAKADSILETVQNNGGVYDFLNICDSTNNTPEIIDNEMLVLDTHIEPARGAGKMVHQLTIHRTGEISSTIR